MAEGLLAELGAGNYRETADKLRRVAVDTLSPENRADLLMIAESFDRLAARDEPQRAYPQRRRDGAAAATARLPA